MTSDRNGEPVADATRIYDAVVVGAGFAGMYMLVKLRDELGLDCRVFERGDDVGGTWYWNRYPGARCDAESIYYSYSFDDQLQQDWTWSERFATQPEILAYSKYVADRFDLRRNITFNTSVVSAEYAAHDELWTITTDTGEHIRARYFITAVGNLSATQMPDIAGIDSFGGATYHTGNWPHEGVDFTGLNVAVIGTGSSGIQAIPRIAEQAAHLTVFQRTPHFSLPARNRRHTDEEMARIKAQYPELRTKALTTAGGSLTEPPKGPASAFTPEQQLAELWRRWEHGGPGFMLAFADAMTNEATNELAADFIRARIREIVQDEHTAELLCPSGYPVGSKRVAVDTDYYATFNRDNVTLISVLENPIEEITATGIKQGGTEHSFDAIVFATGYDAMTGPLLRLGIHGVDGVPLSEKWAAGPRTYLGAATAGFPNMFMITGPGSPSVLTTVVCAIEQHVDWIAEYIKYLDDRAITRTEPDLSAEDEWVQHVNDLASNTLFARGNSWYLGANVPGKPRVFMPYAGGLGTYRSVCNSVAAEGYKGFTMSAAASVDTQETAGAAS